MNRYCHNCKGSHHRTYIGNARLECDHCGAITEIVSGPAKDSAAHQSDGQDPGVRSRLGVLPGEQQEPSEGRDT